MYPPDGLLTLEDPKHDVDLYPHIIAPDPFELGNCLNASPPAIPFLLTTTQKLQDTMSTGDDDPPSGLNGRLRPRKSLVPSPQTHKAVRKPEGKTCPDKSKTTTAPSTVSPNKQDDLVNKSDFSSAPQFLCAYCDKRFATRQTMSKHARRIHLPTSRQDFFIKCLYCDHMDGNSNNIIRHMVDTHPNQYFACFDCLTRFPSTLELAEHKMNVCEKLKLPYRSKLRQKITHGSKRNKKAIEKGDLKSDRKTFRESDNFNGVVISCELKPPQNTNEDDIEDNITTNVILPPNRNLGNNTVLEKSAVIVLDDIHWNKRIPPNFSFHNTDADQILSRLGVVHRSPRTGESTRRDWIKAIDDSSQKFERCFDTSFYSKVASNVQENLSKFLDGSFNFNPDPDNVIKTRKSKNSVVINTAEGFPILLAGAQFSRSVLDGYMPRGIAPKHKWKWDNIDNEKTPMNADQIKRDSHANNCIISFVSSLDIWTQLCMRRKFEDKFNIFPLEKKTEKQNVIGKQLKEILESREIPTTSQVINLKSHPTPSSDRLDFPASLGLAPSTPSYELQPAVLSGEWVRPRCYVCCACGAQTRDSRTLSSHISTEHPNAQVQHYEVVGEILLNADILKHLYVPPSQVCNRTRPLRGFRECTKCRKSITLEDLHQHMLDCAGDTPTVRRRQCRYRPFGVRRRRPRLPDNTVRKKIRKDLRARQRRQKKHIRPRQRIRTEVGDAETIRKMLADLPAKRHRVMVNPTNQISRPRRILDKQRNKLLLKKRSIDDTKNREISFKNSSNLKQTSTQYATKHLSNKDDDDDNKPLKSTVLCVPNTNIHRNQGVKRNTAINRAKRKYIRVNEQNQKRDVKNITMSKNIEIEKLSIDAPPEKIDVKAGPYNTRDHANRGGSKQRDSQRPGSSGRHGNSTNSQVPTQTVPLKHSIARLTANSETHDKSVQFHHLFLVQQECNNGNQHVSAEEQTLFENEAIVTRLDKPPLRFIQKGIFELQKNKQNKPRKGLNDCIAMLKNKLVDGIPCPTTGRASVQCGPDEPFDFDVPVLNENISGLDSLSNVRALSDVVHQPEMLQATLRQGIIIREPSEMNKSTFGYTETHNRHNSVEEDSVGLDSSNISRQPESITELKETSARNTSLEKEFIQSKMNSAIINEVTEVHPDISKSINQSSPTDALSVTALTTHKLNQARVPCDLETESNRNNDHSTVVTIEPHPNLAFSDKEYLWESQCEICVTKVIDQKPTEEQHALKKEEQNNIVETNPHKQIKDESIIRKLQIEDFIENNHGTMPVAIPPAHASTNVAPILAAPLDLSSKVLSVPSNSYETYDSYGTLDLSNKCSDKQIQETDMISDEVVDLRIKPSLSDSQLNTMDSYIKSTTDVVNDLSINTQSAANTPTDLSLKGKETLSNLIDLSDKKVELNDLVQDLSSSNSKSTRTGPKESSASNDPKDSASDISGRAIIDEIIPPMHEAVPIDDNISRDLNSLVDLNESVVDVSENVDTGKIDHRKHLQITSTEPVLSCTEISSKLSTNVNKTEIEEMHSENTVPSCVTDKYIPRPIYDPTLKIPQYKVRTTLITCVVTTSDLVDTKVDMNVKLVTSIASQDSVNPKTAISVQEVDPNASVSKITESSPNCIPNDATNSVDRKFDIIPVYTAPIYKSVSGLESSCSPTLTNAVVRAPGKSIVNSTTIYTLPKTTAVAGPNFESKNSLESQKLPVMIQSIISTPRPASAEGVNASTTHTYTDYNIENKIENLSNTNAVVNSDEETETARKIAMLPQELVAILGNMPADHRKQLLNVLPQYVSHDKVTTQNPITETVTNLTVTNTVHKPPQSLALGQDQLTIITRNNSHAATSESPYILSSSCVIPSASNTHETSHLKGESDTDKKQINHSALQSGSTLATSNKNDDTLPVLASENSKEIPTLDTDKFLIDPFTGAITKRPPVNIQNNIDGIIDLTNENLPIKIDVLKISEDLAHSIKLPSQEIPGLGAVGKSARQKCSNEKTASLRAVRIKAPSERQKDNQFLKKISAEQISKAIQNGPNNDFNTLSETKKSLAIQQAEISSTQHSNKNVVIDPKLSNDVSAIAKNINIRPRRIPTPNQIITKTNNNVKEIDKTILKPGLVTSSISANNTNLVQVTKEIPGSEDLKNTSNLTGVVTQKELVVINEQHSLNISELNFSNIPFQSSTPIQKSERNLAENSAFFLKERVTENDEDSEDDVSLAIIVKQKQQKLLTFDENSYDQSSLRHENTSTKKNKMQKKVIQIKSSSCHSTPEIVVNLEHDEKDSTIKGNTDGTTLLKYCQLDVNNGYMDGVKCHQNTSDKIKLNENEVNTILDHLDRPNTSVNVIKDNSIIDNFDSTGDDQCALNLRTSEEAGLLKQDASKDRKQKENVNKNNKCGINDNDYNEIANPENPESITEENDLALPNQNQMKNEVANSAEQDDILYDSLKCPGEERNIEKDSANVKMIRKSIRKHKSNIIECVNADIANDLNTVDESLTPVRRSKRGKSLFLEGTIPAPDNSINNEISRDKKLPLTKKQLIFSKLLLDEETQARNQNLHEKETAVVVTDDLPKEEIPKADNICCYLIPHRSDMESINEYPKERSKSTKRKKSPHFNRKCKKTKSTDFSTDNQNVVQPPQSLTAHVSMEVEKVQPGLRNNISHIIQQDDKEHHEYSSVDVLHNTVTDCLSESNTCSDYKQTLISTEKRHLEVSVMSIDYNQSSKPKKSKLNKDIILLDTEIDRGINGENGIVGNKSKKCLLNSEKRQITCYNNTFVAARRTRSKSVVVKSSNTDLYDPYDIDLDDMDEKTEPFRKKSVHGIPANKFKSYQFSEVNTSKKQDLKLNKKEIIDIDVGRTKSTEGIQSALGFPKRSSKRNKTLKSTDLGTNKCTKSMSYGDRQGIATTSVQTKSAMFCKEDITRDNSCKKMPIVVVRDLKPDLCDSDESSKSDVPLKKYIEKKLAEDRNSGKEIMDMEVAGTSKKQNEKPTRNRRTLGVSNKADSSSAPNEAEEQLRSEQFMESFGFFSKRKPRKSNLLAAKKISETFHIIANESDDVDFGGRRRTKRSLQNENKKSDGCETQHIPTKKCKRGRKKKNCKKSTTCYCDICKKEFRRPDNYLRHQMTLLHISKLSEVELNQKTEPVPEEPNYLIAYKQHLDRLKMLKKKLAKRKKGRRSKIVLPTLEQILIDVNRTVREQQLAKRNLSRDQALFLDCCELLKESHRSKSTVTVNNILYPTKSVISGVEFIQKFDDEKIDNKSDGDVDSITAKNILESEEVRNLENDLISGLKEAASVSGRNILKADYYQIDNTAMGPIEVCVDSFSSASSAEYRNDQPNYDVTKEPDIRDTKKQQSELKGKMYPDLENIDIFEDKFDKIKRKCRSQAAAAKQLQTVVEPSSSPKVRKKSEKKKGKKNLKKNNQSTVLTKGALKGFDGIKVSIPTSDINMAAIVPPHEKSLKKKRKTTSKKKKDKKVSEPHIKHESDNLVKENLVIKHDVYEFMDNDDAELFEFRPSTLMERFKNISSKDTHLEVLPKLEPKIEEMENTSESASDGDDFVYMSDDYVCSDDETENSLLSCEMANVKGDNKKNPLPLKRKDIVEKNAVMGKIFKHNAVRTEKKSTKSKESIKPKANLDQLFDSLLVDEPNSSALNNDGYSPKKGDFGQPLMNVSVLSSKYKQLHEKCTPSPDTFISPKKFSLQSPDRFDDTLSSSSGFKSTSPLRRSSDKYNALKKYDASYLVNYGPSTSKAGDAALNSDISTPKRYKKGLLKKHVDSTLSTKRKSPPVFDDSVTAKNDNLLDSKDKLTKKKSPNRTLKEAYDCSNELVCDETGVARQRARRKCTVGKQNILAETWSSESEPDGVPPRPNSAESVLSGAGRKKKGKKKDAQQLGGRRGHKQVAIKKQDVESRVNISNRNSSSSGNIAKTNCVSSGIDGVAVEGKAVCSAPRILPPPPAPKPGPSETPAPLGPPGPLGLIGRQRSVAYYWSSEGDEEQEHLQQQHGWIVGDSHKKLVTMLAHAKGRKRNNDDKSHLIE